jgi:hypothetical protein
MWSNVLIDAKQLSLHLHEVVVVFTIRGIVGRQRERRRRRAAPETHDTGIHDRVRLLLKQIGADRLRLISQ